jgi:hypothetical protein
MLQNFGYFDQGQTTAIRMIFGQPQTIWSILNQFDMNIEKNTNFLAW